MKLFSFVGVVAVVLRTEDAANTGKINRENAASAPPDLTVGGSSSFRVVDHANHAKDFHIPAAPIVAKDIIDEQMPQMPNACEHGNGLQEETTLSSGDTCTCGKTTCSHDGGGGKFCDRTTGGGSCLAAPKACEHGNGLQEETTLSSSGDTCTCGNTTCSHDGGGKFCDTTTGGSCAAAPKACPVGTGLKEETLSSGETCKCGSGSTCSVSDKFCDSATGRCADTPKDCTFGNGLQEETLSSGDTCTCGKTTCSYDGTKKICDYSAGTCAATPWVAVNLDASSAKDDSGPAGGQGQVVVREGIVYKPVDDLKSRREESFYDWMKTNKDHCLKKFLPEYYGRRMATLRGKTRPYIALNDVASTLSCPSILDLKIGTPIYHKSAPVLHKIKQSLYWMQQVLGFSVNGYKACGGTAKKHRKPTKMKLKTLLTRRLVRWELDRFFEGFSKCGAHRYSALLEELNLLKNCVKQERAWEFIGSSILLTYEGEPSDTTSCSIGVHLIDFAYAERVGEDHHDSTFVKGYLKGLANLERYFRKSKFSTTAPKSAAGKTDSKKRRWNLQRGKCGFWQTCKEEQVCVKKLSWNKCIDLPSRTALDVRVLTFTEQLNKDEIESDRERMVDANVKFNCSSTVLAVSFTMQLLLSAFGEKFQTSYQSLVISCEEEKFVVSGLDNPSQPSLWSLLTVQHDNPTDSSLKFVSHHLIKWNKRGDSDDSHSRIEVLAASRIFLHDQGEIRENTSQLSAALDTFGAQVQDSRRNDEKCPFDMPKEEADCEGIEKVPCYYGRSLVVDTNINPPQMVGKIHNDHISYICSVRSRTLLDN